MLANVKIEQDKQHKIIHRVFVNGKKWKEKYVPGIITDSPNIVFDFTEHDMKVLEKR